MAETEDTMAATEDKSGEDIVAIEELLKNVPVKCMSPLHAESDVSYLYLMRLTLMNEHQAVHLACPDCGLLILFDRTRLLAILKLRK